jgi:hypothetical protein
MAANGRPLDRIGLIAIVRRANEANDRGRNQCAAAPDRLTLPRLGNFRSRSPVVM